MRVPKPSLNLGDLVLRKSSYSFYISSLSRVWSAEYKALLMCHKIALCDSDPSQYINDVKIHTPARVTRSCESVSYFKAKLKSASERAIDHYTPKPPDLPNLKTYLFRQHFH